MALVAEVDTEAVVMAESEVAVDMVELAVVTEMVDSELAVVTEVVDSEVAVVTEVAMAVVTEVVDMKAAVD